MTDFNVIDVPATMHVIVETYDADGNQLPDDGEWHRHVATCLYVFAELLAARQLIEGRSAVTRTPDLVIKWSELTEVGQAFVKAAMDKWQRSVDDMRTTEAAMIRKLERRWQKFAAERALS